MKRVIVWFRNDLRLHDNEALTEALKQGDEIIPIYVFDTRLFKGKTPYGFRKIERFRAKFIIESVSDLRQRLKKLNSTLYVRIGKPEEIIPQIAEFYNTTAVYCNKERTDEEVKVQNALEKKLWSIKQEIRFYRGKMLYHTADLPFPVPSFPDTFSTFRKEVEKSVNVRNPLAEPSELMRNVSFDLEEGEIPSLEDFDLKDFKIEKGIGFRGGESAGLQQLKYYLWESDGIATYKETRNGMLGRDYSSKFSPYLAQGCLSPKQIYIEIKKYESQRLKNRSTYHLVFELLWRDFFRFIAKKYGNRIFQENGIKKPKNHVWTNNTALFNIWKEGRTGIPFIDANMRELSKTGFMSNRGRQNVASFLVHDLKVNWLLGAEYFESMLIDYDPCSNYGNWNYVAGVGTDPRPSRKFNVRLQAQKYDSQGNYVKYWCPELDSHPEDKVHKPINIESGNGQSFILGRDYPRAIINI